MELADFYTTIDYWIIALDNYSFGQLTYKYQPDKWSMGQLFIHLIDSTEFFLESVVSCINNPKNADEPQSNAARRVFQNNQLPDMELSGPDSNNFTPQPESIEMIKTGLEKLKKMAQAVSVLLQDTATSGKTKHPGLGYFNAEEWFRFAELHMRHHIRQRTRIDDQLNKPGFNYAVES